jgi:hypothetical protein
VAHQFGQYGKILLLILMLLSTGCRGKAASPPGSDTDELDNAPDRVKLLVDEAGIYRVTARELAAAGIDTDQGLTYETIRLSSGKEEAPYLIQDDGQDTALIFYGQPSDDRYYAKRPYMLHVGQPGRAMSQAEVHAASEPFLESIRQTLRLEEDLAYVPEARQEDSDVWFWAKLSQQDAFTTDFNLPTVADGAFWLRFNVWGFSQDTDLENDHDFEILVNEQPVGTAVFDGQKHYTGELILPPSTLHPGANTITLDNRLEGTAKLDIFQLNWLELNYPAAPEAVDDRLEFAAESGSVRLGGFSGRPVVLDISDAGQPQSLHGWQYENGQIELALNEGQHLTAAGPAGFLKPDLERITNSSWLDTSNQADLIIITTKEMVPALDSLVSARQDEGLNAAVVPVNEIFDEVGYGAPSPDAIRDFVAYAYENWQAPRPRYLLLVGDATSDYLGHLGPLPEVYIPSAMVPVQVSGETVSDSRLADVDEDGRPELAVGRWPVRTAKEAADLVQRTLDYEAKPAGSKAFFAADGSERSFVRLAADIIDRGQLNQDQVILAGSPTAANISELWREDPWLAAYLGHGSIDRWGKDDIFSLEELGRLRSGSAPIVLQLTCLTGLFSDPRQTSLSEGMLLHPNGPVLVIGASSLTYSHHQEPFAVALLQALQNDNIERIGDAFLAAKVALDIENSNGYREISDTFALFGDPSAKISRP